MGVNDDSIPISDFNIFVVVGGFCVGIIINEWISKLLYCQTELHILQNKCIFAKITPGVADKMAEWSV